MERFSGSLRPERFEVAIPQQQIDDFKTLLRLSELGPQTYENKSDDSNFGISRSWVKQAKDQWLDSYEWRKTEKRINSFENYKAQLSHRDGGEETVHFLALVSERKDAIPVVLIHGWPGSFLEFLDLLDLVRSRSSPSEWRYTFIVPSLPGFGFSSGLGDTQQLSHESSAAAIHTLMEGLGYGSGYVAQGGDIGSFVARILASKYEFCKAVHINFSLMQPPEGVDPDTINPEEMEGLARASAFSAQGDGYARIQGQRPATIGLVLSTSPLALLIWVGEKFKDWTDTDLPMDKVLDHVTLYWLTQTMPHALYPYREFFGPHAEDIAPKYRVEKPLGYSWFPKEIAPIPRAWVATTGNLVWYKQHHEGGHFAAMEKPAELLADIESFVTKVWV